jgi:holo-ACP synthase
MTNKILLQEILLARENRANKQKELINEYNCSLISFTLNIPGSIKDTYSYRKIHDEGMKRILEFLREKNRDIIYQESNHEKTGSEGYICVDSDPIDLKKYTIKLEENHPLGRLFDFDIIDKDFNLISRRDLKLKSRKCLLCDDEAIVCRRMKKHSIEELLQEIDRLEMDYFSKR